MILQESKFNSILYNVFLSCSDLTGLTYTETQLLTKIDRVIIILESSIQYTDKIYANELSALSYIVHSVAMYASAFINSLKVIKNRKIFRVLQIIKKDYIFIIV